MGLNEDKAERNRDAESVCVYQIERKKREGERGRKKRGRERGDLL